jgi:hypothetical protein
MITDQREKQKKWAQVTQPHDCTSFVWEDLKFIPIIGSAAGIEIESFYFIFSLTYFRDTRKKKIYSIQT